MSLLVIAVTGILLGFLCVMVGFFMEGADSRRGAAFGVRPRKTRAPKRRVVVPRKKAA